MDKETKDAGIKNILSSSWEIHVFLIQYLIDDVTDEQTEGNYREASLF